MSLSCWGRYLNDVRKIFRILDPLPPFVTHSRYLSVVFFTYWVGNPPSPLSADVIFKYRPLTDSLNSWSHTYIPTLWRPLGIVIDR